MKQMTNEEYVSRSGNVCPFCGNLEVEGGATSVDGKEAWQTVQCSACEKEWLDIYVLTRFLEC